MDSEESLGFWSGGEWSATESLDSSELDELFSSEFYPQELYHMEYVEICNIKMEPVDEIPNIFEESESAPINPPSVLVEQVEEEEEEETMMVPIITTTYTEEKKKKKRGRKESQRKRKFEEAPTSSPKRRPGLRELPKATPKQPKTPLYLKTSRDECEDDAEWEKAKRAGNTKRFHERRNQKVKNGRALLEKLLTCEAARDILDDGDKALLDESFGDLFSKYFK